MFNGDVDISLRPATVPPITQLDVVGCLIYQVILLVVIGEWDIGPRPANIPPKEEILGVMVQDMKVGLKISTTLNW